MIITKIVIFVAVFFAGISCTTLPDHRCTEGAEIQAPSGAERTIDLACKRFSQRTDADLKILSLSNVEIEVRSWREQTKCISGAAACARLLPEPVVIDVQLEDWRSKLIHEVYHVLLWKTRPDIHPDDHHAFMYRHRLCVRLEFCGIKSRRPVR